MPNRPEATPSPADIAGDMYRSSSCNSPIPRNLLRQIMGPAIVMASSLYSSHAAAESNWPDALKPYAGHVVYVDFWASWCGPCAQSFEWLNSLQAEYGSRLTIVAVDVDENKDNGEAFLLRHPATFKIVFDPSGQLAELYKVEGMPSAVILDAEGHVIHRHAGFISSKVDEYENAVSNVLSAR